MGHRRRCGVKGQSQQPREPYGAMNMQPPHSTSQTCTVFDARDLKVVLGANAGHPLAVLAELAPGDIYALSRQAEPRRLILSGSMHGEPAAPSAQAAPPPPVIAEGSEIGRPGVPIQPQGRLTLMAEDGTLQEVLVLRCEDRLFIRPLAGLRPLNEYTLIQVEAHSDGSELSEATCVSFTRGTHITLSSGAQRRVEELEIGQKVLTRDHGAQPIRWIGHQTVRAQGPFAPVFISKGAMNNAEDLIVSPDHRLFIYQRRDAIGLGKSEVLVKARHLINDETIFQREGGFVDYFHLLFDEHEIIFAEGIAAESLMVTSHTLAALPPEMADEVQTSHGDRASTPHRGVESDLSGLEGKDAAEVLRKASGTR